MSIGDYTRAPHPGKRNRQRTRRSRRQRHVRTENAPLGQLVGYYLYALASSVIAKVLFLQAGLPVSILGWIIAHMYAGYRLNRAILPHFQWLPLTSSVASIANAKLSALLFWPVTYAVFLFQVWVIRNL